MFTSNASHRGIARTLSTLMALTIGATGLTASGATATSVETPQNVTAVSTTEADNTGTVVVTWDSVVDPDSISIIDVGLTGQADQQIASDYPDGATFSGVAPGNYTTSVAFEYADSSPASGASTFEVTVIGATVADEPLNLTARDIADGTVGVFWGAPFDGGSDITDYRVVLSFPDGDLDEWDNFPVYTSGAAPDGATRDAAFTEMPFDQGDYIVTVKAINAAGEGPAASTGPHPMLHSTVSAEPQDVAATSTAAETVFVSWTPPAFDGGQPVDRYDIALGDDTQSTDGQGRDVTFDGVAAGEYTAQVTAHNSNGSSASNSALVTVEGGPGSSTSVPSAPTLLRASQVKTGGVTTIRWRASTANANVPVFLYLVIVDGRFSIVDGTDTKVKVKGLRAGPAKVIVLAMNENGFSGGAVIKIHVAKRVAKAPKETLRLGMTGPAVQRLQMRLGMRHPNGTFGQKTRAVVLDLQKWSGLKGTGEVNDRLRYLLRV